MVKIVETKPIWEILAKQKKMLKQIFVYLHSETHKY